MQQENFKTVQALKDMSAQNSLNDREKQLIGLAVTITRGCTACTSGRFNQALKSGITHQELLDLVDLVAMTNAGINVRTAISSAEIGNIAEACQDDTCKV